MESKPPKLRVVPDPNDPAFELIPAPPRPKPDQPVRARLPRGRKPFVRVPWSWVSDRRRFPAHTSLLLVLIYRSREGQQPVRLTLAVAKEAGIDPRRRSLYARQLERSGDVRITRDGQHSLTLTVLSTYTT